jgi:uncharacterized protein (DUF362 family)
MNKALVAIVKGDQAQPMVEEALLLLGGVESLIKPNSTVVIKPNAGHYYPPETSVNTSPAMVKAVINAVKKGNPRKIILAEASAIGTDTMECLEISGIKKAAEEAGVDALIDIKREKDLINIPIRDARSDLTRVLLPRFLLEADHIINVPIFKSHVSMVFTCTLKNIKGVVQDKVHNQMHRTNLTEAIMDLWSVIKADLNIVDMIRPAEGFGPHSPTPVDFGCVVVSKDPVALDATICRMIGLDTKNVLYFQAALERGLGAFKESDIEIRGKSVEEVYKKLWIPYLGRFDQWPEYHIHAENACSSCQGLLAYSMECLKALGLYEQNAGLHIVVGSKKALPPGVDPEQIILVGDCNKKFRGKGISAGGCPPAESWIIFAIRDHKDYFEDGPTTRQEYEQAAAKFKGYIRKKYKNH